LAKAARFLRQNLEMIRLAREKLTVADIADKLPFPRRDLAPNEWVWKVQTINGRG